MVISQFYTTSQVAKMFGVSKSTVLQWISDGLLAAFRLPGLAGVRKGHYRIADADIKDFAEINRLPVPAQLPE